MAPTEKSIRVLLGVYCEETGSKMEIPVKECIAMSEQNKALMSRIVEELWNKKNPRVIDELYADNYVGHTPDSILKGHAGARQHYNTYIAAFPDCRIAIDGMVAEGDKVSVRWTATGTHRGELAGIAPTGKRISVPGNLTVRISGGKVVEDHSLWDTLKLAQQIGAVGEVGQAKGATR
jgi:predicted ester cyclase